jgi:hypothetical protein
MPSRTTAKGARLVAAGLFGTAATVSALAQGVTPAQGLLTDTFVFNLGAFVVGTDTKAALNGSTSTNQEVDFNDTLGLGSDATRVRLDGLWRINPKHHLRFLYFDNRNSVSKVIDRDVQWGDYTFHANGQVDTDLKLRTYELAYEYAFWREPNYEISGTIGLHYSEISLRLSGQATITSDGGESAAASVSKSNSLAAPLPVIGLRAGWAVAPQWYLDAQLQLFGVNIDGYDGSWSDVRLGATWMFHRNWGLGLGYDRWTTRVDVNKDQFNGSLKTGYSGLQAFLTGSF